MTYAEWVNKRAAAIQTMSGKDAACSILMAPQDYQSETGNAPLAEIMWDVGGALFKPHPTEEQLGAERALLQSVNGQQYAEELAALWEKDASQ